MSRVFVARDVSLNRHVVVKVLAPELIEGLSVERFTREIKMAAALQEPHIVPVLSAGTTADGLPYYTMPMVEGESLRVHMLSGRVPIGEALSILRDIAKALSYAHARHIVHRDIKPENILLSSGTAVVTDFGIAKALQLSRTQASDDATAAGITRTGTSLGTPAYMAPEQAAADPRTDQRADIYAWGVIAYELLAGKHPFASKTTPQQLLTAHMAEAPAALITTGSQASRTVMDLVMRCLEKNPQNRPADAGELLRVLDGASTAAETVSTPSRSRAALVIATIAALAIAVAFSIKHFDGAESVAAKAEPIMIAVLPFHHSGPDDQQAFTDGLTDAITAKLGSLDALAVIDRQSAGQYRGSTKPTKQIGSELGVLYLVEGVVRWTKDGSGAWLAHVTPTLVDAKGGTTRWTGDPVAISLTDPLSAQTTVATDVAKALQVQLMPKDRARLSQNFSKNPAALAAFDRGVAILNEARRKSVEFDRETQERALLQFREAVNLDSTFGFAWATLVGKSRVVVEANLTDTIALNRYHRLVDEALRYAPDNGLVLLEAAQTRLVDYKNGKIIDVRDTVSADSLVTLAVQVAPREAYVLQNAGIHWFVDRDRLDTGYALIKRSAAMDPRSIRIVDQAGIYATVMQRWEEARRFGNAVIEIDSSDQRGWKRVLEVDRRTGDTVALTRDLDRALSILHRPTIDIYVLMGVANEAYRKKFLSMSADQLQASTLRDSVVRYYGEKSDAAARDGDLKRSRTYSDSINSLLKHRLLSIARDDTLLLHLAYAQANLGMAAEARGTLERVLEITRDVFAKKSTQGLPTDRLDGLVMAGTYAHLGEAALAMRWSEATRGMAPAALATHPKLAPLRGTAAMQNYLGRQNK